MAGQNGELVGADFVDEVSVHHLIRKCLEG